MPSRSELAATVTVWLKNRATAVVHGETYKQFFKGSGERQVNGGDENGYRLRLNLPQAVVDHRQPSFGLAPSRLKPSVAIPSKPVDVEGEASDLELSIGDIQGSSPAIVIVGTSLKLCIPRVLGISKQIKLSPL
ncbi:hypothetical protein L484_012011 [Morus notabilis]|uniref:Uncharacterized protein n=1 Tax=Morus notabilis TaxID=981085 RepID=W9RM25_9ROSA|nr:hypothetical protein L484_012011 [Morus notabilis]